MPLIYKIGASARRQIESPADRAHQPDNLPAILRLASPHATGAFKRFSLRAASEADRPFLFSLRTTTMKELIEQTWEWDEKWQRQDIDRKLR